MAPTIDRVFAVGGLVLVGLLVALGGLDPLDRMAFDVMVRVGSVFGDRGSAPRVVAVPLGREVSGVEFGRAVEAVRRAGAAEVVVVADGGSGMAGEWEGVMVGVRGGVAGADGLPPAVVPGSWDGIQREFWPEWDGRPTLPAVVARAMRVSVPDGRRLCLFRVPRGSLAELDGAQVMAPLGAPRSVVAGRVVVMGRADAGEVPVTTPLHRGGEALPPLLFHAAVLGCVLDGSLARELSSAWSWAGALAVGLLVVAVGSAWERVGMIPVAVGAVGVVVVGAAVLLHVGRLWIPPSAVVLSVAVASGAVAWRRRWAQRSGIEAVVRRLSAETEERAGGKAFLVADSPWPRIRAAWSAAFGIPCCVVLVPSVPGGVVLEPECGSGDGTGDAGRVVGAVFGGRLPRADDEPFERARATGEVVGLGGDRHVVALSGERRLHGYLVFAGSSERLPRKRVAEFAAHLGGMLEARDRWRARARPHELLGVRDGGGVRFRPLHDRLAGAIDLLDGHRHLLAGALAATREATWIIDVSGEVLDRSPAAAALGADLDLDLEGRDPGEWLASVTGREPGECRRWWRAVLLGGEEPPVVARPQLLPGRRHLVRLAALAHPVLGGAAAVVIRLEDVTGLARGAVLKDEFLERICYQLNNDFESIIGAASIIDDRRLAGDDRAVLAGAIRRKAAAVGALLERTRGHLRSGSPLEPPDAFPVRIDPVLEAAAALVDNEAAGRGVVIERGDHPFAQLVFACPRRLEALVASVLRVLVRDAREGTTIRVAASQGASGLVVALENEGFGMPGERLRACLADPPPADRILTELVRARRCLPAWGAALTADAAVGAGLRFQLRLRSIV